MRLKTYIKEQDMKKLANWMIKNQTKLPGTDWGKAIEFVAKEKKLTDKQKKKLSKYIDRYTER